MNAAVLFDNVPVMFNASSDADRVTLLNKGDNVAVLEKTSKLWWKVAHNEFSGYVKTKYLKSENEDFGDVIISMPRECALALYEALKFALE